MKFLIISQDAGSPHHGMVIRNYNWAKTLIEKGHDVTIMTSSYAHSRNFNPIVKGIKPLKENIDGIEYRWLQALRYNAKNKLFRLFSIAFFVAQLYLYKLFTKEEYDVVICSCPVPFQLYPAISIAKKMQAKFVFDIRDLWPLTPIHLGGYSESHPLIKVMAHAESYALKKADLVTSAASNANEYFISKGMAEKKFLFIGNGAIELKKVRPEEHLEDHIAVLNDLRKKHDFIISYTGSFGVANALDSFVKAVAQTPNNIAAVIIGSGPEKLALKKLIDEFGLEGRFRILDPIPASQINNFLNYVDAGYCGLKDKPIFHYGVSATKLNDFMMASKPILYAIGNHNNIIDQSGCGIAAPPEDPDGIALAIKQMADLSRAERQKMGALGHEWLLENNLVSGHMDKVVERLKA